MDGLFCFCIVFIKDSDSPRKKAIAIPLLLLSSSRLPAQDLARPHQAIIIHRPSIARDGSTVFNYYAFLRTSVHIQKNKKMSTHKDGVTLSEQA